MRNVQEVFNCLGAPKERDPVRIPRLGIGHSLIWPAIPKAGCRNLPTAIASVGADNPRMSYVGLENWRSRIECCFLDEELLLAVGAYLAEWRPHEVIRLPVGLTAPIRSIDDLHRRGIEVIHAEIGFRGSNADWHLFRELALTITAAAARARQIELRAVYGKPQFDLPRHGAS